MQIAGRVTIQRDGQTLRSIPGAEINLGGIQREAQADDHNVNHTESLQPATITCRVNLARGESVEALRNMSDATCTFALDTGQTYIVRHAFTTNTLRITGGENGTIQLEIAGDPATEVV